MRQESCAGNAQAPCWLVEGDYTEMREEIHAHVPMGGSAQSRDEGIMKGGEKLLSYLQPTQPSRRARHGVPVTGQAMLPTPLLEAKKQETQSSGDAYVQQQKYAQTQAQASGG